MKYGVKYGGGGVGLFTVYSMIVGILKVTGTINVSWFAVFAPQIVSIVIVLIFLAVAAMIER